MTKSLLLILSLLFFSGYIMLSNKKQEHHPSKGEQLIDSTLTRAAKILQVQYNIKASGVGVSMPGGPIKGVTLCFDTKNPYTKDQLRKLLINSSVELLRQINENKDIQDFLKERPFSIKNVEIVIYNHDENGFILKDPQISVADISQGTLNYTTIDPEDSFKYKNEYEETYEEALKAISKP